MQTPPMIDDYSSPNTSTTKNDIQDYNCVLFWISEQDGLKSNMLVQVSFPPCCQLTLCNGVPRQAHAGISARSKLFKTFQPKISFCPDICCPMQNCGAYKMSAILDWECCPPFSPKTIRIALWRTLPKLFCLFLHFFFLLFGGIGLELLVHPSWSAFMCIYIN